MKRRTFIERAALGLSALAVPRWASPAKGKQNPDRRLYGTPGSVDGASRLEKNLLRFELARSEVPAEVWDEILGAGLLAQDICRDATAARAFRNDPPAYLRRHGLEGLNLDPEAAEVRVALALGEPELREAARRQDPRAFLEELDRLEILRTPNPSILAAQIASQLESAGVQATPEACTLTAICLAVVWIWVTVVQDAVALVNAAAFVTVYVSVLVVTETIGPQRRRLMVEALGSHPSLGVARLLGGSGFGQRVAEDFVEKNVERAAEAVEALSLYQQHQPMTSSQLRELIRRQLQRRLVGGQMGQEGSTP